jgi:D-amino peptidase
MLRTVLSRLGVLVFLGWIAHPSPASAKGARIYILLDGEGANNITNSPKQLSQDVRTIKTGEVNAAIEGLFEAGASEITVEDTSPWNMILEKLNPKVRLIRTLNGVPLGLPTQLKGFDALVQLQMHASSHTFGGVAAHTMNPERFFDIKINGQHMSEAILNSAIAGHFGIPVLMVSGDDKAVEETRRVVDPRMPGAVVKTSLGMHSVNSLSMSAANALIKDTAKAALGQLGTLKPFKLSKPPYRVEMQLMSASTVECLALLPIVEVVDGLTIRYQAPDILAAWKFIWFVARYSCGAVQPEAGPGSEQR